jgi:hypothetical protein
MAPPLTPDCYNGDGNLDLAVGFQSEHTISILLGTRYGDFTQGLYLLAVTSDQGLYILRYFGGATVGLMNNLPSHSCCSHAVPLCGYRFYCSRRSIHHRKRPGGQVQLRAERSNQGNGRLYTINAVATDLAGNTTAAMATCTVAK